MALLKPNHLTRYHSLRLIMSSRFLLPTHGLSISSICPSPSILLQSRSSLGVRTLSTNRVLVPRALVSPRAFMSSSPSSVAEVRKGKDGSEHYGSENIQILEGLEAVRKRPGMYIGNTGPRGLHHMVYEILDNGVDEAQAGFASKVDIVLHADGSVCITDNGRGIPIDLHPGSKKSGVETVLTVLHAGGKFGGESSGYKVSGGLHGVGLSVVNALSETLEVTVWRDGKECHQIYFRGKPHKPLACKDLPAESADRTGTCIKFWPDSEIFTSGTEFDYDTIAARVRERAFLVPGLTITLKKEDEDPEKNRIDEYCFAGGLVEYVKWLNADKQPLHDVLSFRKEADEMTVDVAFQWCSDAYSDTMLGYANSIRTIDGGTHIDGIKASLTRTLNNLGKKSKVIKEKDISLSGEHVREGLTCVISIKLPNPEFEGQTKTRLGNPEVRKIVDLSLQEFLTEYLELNPDVLDLILSKSLNALKAAQAAKRARELERQKSVLKVSSLPGKLADCAATDPEIAVEDERDTYLHYYDPTEFLNDMPTNRQQESAVEDDSQLPGFSVERIASLSRSNLGVRTLSTNRVLVPRAFMSSSPISFIELRKRKDGSGHYGSENFQVEELRSKSFEPYAYKWDRTHTANQLQEMYKHLGNGEELNGENDQVSISGRIVAHRAFRKLVFLTLRDDSGTIQLYCEKERLVKYQFEQLKSLVDIGDILGASGSIKRTEKGELSVCVNSFLILAMCLLPSCWSPETGFGLKETITPAISKFVDDPEVAFSVLDAILKHSLDRLKLMRENMSQKHISHYNYTLRQGYTQHLDTIRNLSWKGKLGVALWLRNKMIQKGVVPDVVTHNYLVNGFCKVGTFEKAEWLVREMCCWGPPPNCATYNTLMKGYCAFNDIDKALDLISTMNDGKVKPNIVTFNILVHALCKKGLSEEARVLLLKLTDENSEKSLVASTIVMDNCFKDGDTSMALTLWGEISERNKQVDVVAYNVIVNGSCLNWDVIVAYQYVNEMFKMGLLPDNFTYNTLISALCKVGRVDEACYICTVMSRMGVSPDEISHNILIQGLCAVNDLVSAHELLNFMLEKSMVPQPRTWNIIIDGYGKNGDKHIALNIKDKMMKFGVSPNVFTYNALIQMFIKCGEIEEAHSLMKKMLLDGPLPDIVTYNLLVGAESKFGHLYSAYQVYDDMLKRGYDPDIVTYTELIKGYCMRGKVKEAERFFVFEMLQDSKLVIDLVPFQILIKNHFKMKDFDSAYSVYQKWLTMDQAG